MFLFVQDFERYDLCVSLFVLSAFGSILRRHRDAGPPRRDFFRPYRDYEQLVAEQYSMAPTTLDRLIRSEARLDSLAPKHGLLANWMEAMA